MAAINIPLDQIHPEILGKGGNYGSIPDPSSVNLFQTEGALPEIAPKSFTNNNFSAGDMTKDRLYTIMPRSAALDYDSAGVGKYTTERGQIASLRVLSSNKEKSLTARSGKTIDLSKDLNTLLYETEGYKNFFLTDVSVSYNEKLQVTTTFGDGEVAYYFGRQPVVFNLAGMLMDSLYSDWFTKFIALYQTTLRGSQSAKMFELVEIVLPNMKLIGSIMGLSHQQNAARDAEISFSLQFLAKEVVPIAIPSTEGDMTSITGELIDFSVGKEGVGGWGYKLSTGIGQGLSMGSEFSLKNIIDSKFGGLSSLGKDFGESLSAFRSSIFSPIYGIISSITKIIKTSTGDISTIIKSFTDPVNLILKDVMQIATQAVAIANLIETSVNDVISIPDRMVQNARNTLHSLSNSAGVISRVPESVSEVFKRHFKNGRVKKGAAILSSGKSGKKSKGAVLSSGAPYTPTAAYRI